jgi:hypothetical protein
VTITYDDSVIGTCSGGGSGGHDGHDDDHDPGHEAPLAAQPLVAEAHFTG